MISTSNIKELYFKTVYILLVNLIFISNSYCQSNAGYEDKVKAVDNAIQECIDNSKTTDKELIECQKMGIIELDKILNSVYKDILPYVKQNDLNGFKNNQRKWLDFYNTEVAYNNLVLKSKLHGGRYEFGTAVEVEVISRQYQTLKNRVDTLIRYLVIFETGL